MIPGAAVPSVDAVQVEWMKVWLEVAKIVIGAVTAVVTALWILRTWHAQRRNELEKLDDERRHAREARDRDHQQRVDERDRARQRHAALYVNPFMLACEELQSRIWNILRNRGLHALRQRYPHGGYEAETVYLLVQYLGWERLMYRYGPYTHDAELIRRTQETRQILAGDPAAHPDAFWFVRTEQRALAQFIMRRAEGEFGSEFEPISFHRFAKLLTKPPLSTSRGVAESLAALRSAADDANDLHGRERLRQVQHALVSLLGYLESKEGVHLSAYTRSVV